MTDLIVVYDANVLYSAPLRYFLVELALTSVFDARWTEEIHSEWMRNVLQNRPDMTLEQVTRTKNLMNAHVKNCLVTDYEELIPQLQLPDPGDCHVFAAAIRSQASLIVTFNLSDFPNEILAPYNIRAIHPDRFILRLLDINSDAVCQAAENQRLRLRNPPKTPDGYLETLINQGLSQSAARLRELCYRG